MTNPPKKIITPYNAGMPPPAFFSFAKTPNKLLTAPPTQRATEPRPRNGGDVAPRRRHQRKTARSAQKRAPPKTEPTTAATSLHSWERRPAADAQRPTRRRQAAEHDHGRTTRAQRAGDRPENRTTARTERRDGARRRRSARTEKHAERRQNAGEARPAQASGGRRTLGAGRGKPATRRSPERRTAESVNTRRYPPSSLLR